MSSKRSLLDRLAGTWLAGRIFAPRVEEMFFMRDTRDTVGDCILWWRYQGKGYTTNLYEAALFTRDDAERICRIRETDVPIPMNVAKAALHPVVTVESLNKALAS